MAVVWWLHLRSYRDANRAKSAVINKIETEYLTVHPSPTNGPTCGPRVSGWSRRYAELGTVERLAVKSKVASEPPVDRSLRFPRRHQRSAAPDDQAAWFGRTLHDDLREFTAAQYAPI